MYSENASVPDFKGEMRKFHYDLAGAPLPELLAALREIVAVDQLLCGSDWPFTSRASAIELVHKLDVTPLLDARDHQAAMLGNALKLFPRLTDTEDEVSSENILAKIFQVRFNIRLKPDRSALVSTRHGPAQGTC